VRVTLFWRAIPAKAAKSPNECCRFPHKTPSLHRTNCQSSNYRTMSKENHEAAAMPDLLAAAVARGRNAAMAVQGRIRLQQPPY